MIISTTTAITYNSNNNNNEQNFCGYSTVMIYSWVAFTLPRKLRMLNHKHYHHITANVIDRHKPRSFFTSMHITLP